MLPERLPNEDVKQVDSSVYHTLNEEVIRTSVIVLITKLTLNADILNEKKHGVAKFEENFLGVLDYPQYKRYLIPLSCYFELAIGGDMEVWTESMLGNAKDRTKYCQMFAELLVKKYTVKN